MKKTLTKLLSLVLVIVMLFSSVIAASAAITGDKITADPATNIIQGYVGNGKTNADARNATLILDFLDEILKENGKKFEMDLYVTTITIDATSVDGLLKTLDLVKDVAGMKVLKGIKLVPITETFGGGSSLTKLNVQNWKKDQSRAKTGDLNVILNLIAFINDNKGIVSDVVANKFKAGTLVFDLVDIDKIIKDKADLDTANLLPSLLKDPDGLYGKLKGILVGLVYEKDSAAYTEAKKKDVDNIIFENLMGDGLNGLLAKGDAAIKENWVDSAEPNEVWSYLYANGFKLEGALDKFKFNTAWNLDQLIANLANVIWDYANDFIPGLLSNYGTVLNEWLASNEYAAPFAKFVDFTNSVTLDFNATSIKDFNAFVAQILSGIAPSYTGWSNSANLGKNLQDLFVWAIKNRDTSVTNDPYAGIDTSSFAKCALSLAKIIVRINVKDADVVAQMDKCNSATEVITKLLPYILNKDASIVSSKSTTWQTVLGDIAGYYLNDYVPLYTDAAHTKRYAVSSSTSIWDVLNYAANFYMVDLNLDSIFDLTMTQSQSFLTKLDELQKKAFDGITYTKASSYLPQIIEDILALDLEKVVGTDIEATFVNTNTKLSASNLVYKVLDNVITAVVGKSIFSGSFTTIDALLRNDKFGASVETLIDGINNKKSTLLPIILYFVSVLSDKWNFEVTIGNNNAVTVKYGGKTLTKGTDYTVTSAINVKGKSTKVTIKGAGEYAGTVTGISNCTSHSYGAAVCTTKATTAKAGVLTYTCTRCGGTKTESIPFAKTLTLSASSFTYTGKAQKPTVTVKDSSGKVIAASNYTATIPASTSVGTYTVSVALKGNYTGTLKATYKINAASAAKATVTIANQTYTGKALKPAPTVKLGSVTLKNGTDYTVSYANNTNVGTATVKVTFKGNYSGTASKTFTIAPAQVKGLKAASATTTAIKLSWTKVAGAASYQVYQSTDGKKWTLKATVNTNSATIKSLKAGASVQFKVRALDKTKKLIGAYSAVLKAGTLTAAPKISKLTSTKSKTATVTWGKVAGAKNYTVYKSTNGKKWTKVSTTTKTTLTLKKLTGNKNIYVKVLATNNYGKNSAFSAVKNVKVKK